MAIIEQQIENDKHQTMTITPTAKERIAAWMLVIILGLNALLLIRAYTHKCPASIPQIVQDEIK